MHARVEVRCQCQASFTVHLIFLNFAHVYSFAWVRGSHNPWPLCVKIRGQLGGVTSLLHHVGSRDETKFGNKHHLSGPAPYFVRQSLLELTAFSRLTNQQHAPAPAPVTEMHTTMPGFHMRWCWGAKWNSAYLCTRHFTPEPSPSPVLSSINQMTMCIYNFEFTTNSSVFIWKLCLGLVCESCQGECLPVLYFNDFYMFRISYSSKQLCEVFPLLQRRLRARDCITCNLRAGMWRSQDLDLLTPPLHTPLCDSLKKQLS